MSVLRDLQRSFGNRRLKKHRETLDTLERRRRISSIRTKRARDVMDAENDVRDQILAQQEAITSARQANAEVKAAQRELKRLRNEPTRQAIRSTAKAVASPIVVPAKWLSGRSKTSSGKPKRKISLITAPPGFFGSGQGKAKSLADMEKDTIDFMYGGKL